VIVQELNDDVDSAASEVVTTSCEWQTSEAVLIIKGKLACGNVDIVRGWTGLTHIYKGNLKRRRGLAKWKSFFFLAV